MKFLTTLYRNATSPIVLVIVFLLCAVMQFVFGSPMDSDLSAGAALAAGPLVIPSQGGRMRAVYQALQAMFPGISKQLITPSYLRVEQLVDNTKREYNFPVLRENATNLRDTEKRIAKNDVFVITHMGFYLLMNPVDTGVEQLNGVLQTYVNPTALANGGTVADLNAFYNGFWEIKVGSTTFFEAFPNQLTYQVGCSTQTAVIAGVQNAIPASSRAYSDGAPQIDPFPVLSGANSNEVTLTIPTWTGFAAADNDQAATLTYAVFHPYGFLVKNGANYVREKLS